mgnify:CR=1 FL=1
MALPIEPIAGSKVAVAPESGEVYADGKKLVPKFAAIAAATAGDAQSVETDGLATATTATTTVNGTARGPNETSVTISNLDSIAAGDWVCIKFYRDADADNMAGDASLVGLALSYSDT